MEAAGDAVREVVDPTSFRVAAGEATVSRVLCVTWDGGGNVPPMLGLAAELQARDHDVCVLGHSHQRARVASAGLPFQPYSAARPFTSVADNSLRELVALFSDAGISADVESELLQRPADLVIVDCLLFGVMSAVGRRGMPYVVLEHFFDAYLRKRWIRSPLGLGMRVNRLAPTKLLSEARLCLVATLPELDPAGAQRRPANLRYCGPVVHGAPAAPSQPTILVSLSTYNFPGMTQVMQNVLDAVAGIPARIVVTTGPVIDTDALRAPDNAEMHRWLDHNEVLPETSLVVGHGGHATTMAALAHDVPLLILPMHRFLDQPMVGKAVQAAGAGRCMSKRSSARSLRPVIEQLLQDGPHREAAARVGAAIRAMPGSVNVANEIEVLLQQ